MIKNKDEYLKQLKANTLHDDFEKQVKYSFDIVKYYIEHSNNQIEIIRNGSIEIFAIKNINLQYPTIHEHKQMVIFAAQQIIKKYDKEI